MVVMILVVTVTMVEIAYNRSENRHGVRSGGGGVVVVVVGVVVLVVTQTQ